MDPVIEYYNFNPTSSFVQTSLSSSHISPLFGKRHQNLLWSTESVQFNINKSMLQLWQTLWQIHVTTLTNLVQISIWFAKHTLTDWQWIDLGLREEREIEENDRLCPWSSCWMLTAKHHFILLLQTSRGKRKRQLSKQRLLSFGSAWDVFCIYRRGLGPSCTFTMVERKNGNSGPVVVWFERL